MNTLYKHAEKRFAELGIEVEKALKVASQQEISIHCWQGDDVSGFDQKDGKASDGIQTTGNYPGKARNFTELKEDFLQAIKYIPGKKRINLHASYAIFADGNWQDRDTITYENFAPWVDFAKENKLGIDFNPTLFSHPKVKNGLTLSSNDESIRQFWVTHVKACRTISQKIGEALNDKVLCNIWIPDGMKDTPADRLSPRLRLKKSLDEILAEDMPNVIDSVESKVFGIGLESYTVGSSEFYLAYAANNKKVSNLLDAGHYHPTEFISEKLSALLCFNEYIPLHVTRPVRWDSDHVVSFDDETKAIMNELVAHKALDRALIGLDFFDASINRVAAWIIGTRNAQKALLWALLQPHALLKEAEEAADYTERLMLMEEAKMLPFSIIWEEYCHRENVSLDGTWYKEIKKYEQEVLSKRQKYENARND